MTRIIEDGPDFWQQLNDSKVRNSQKNRSFSMERTSTLTFNTILYLSLSPTEKRIILYLRSVKREGLPIFPSRKRIAQKSKCSVEMVRKFFKKNRDLGNILFEKTHRFDQRTKRQTSNLYDLSKPLLRALEWLDIA